MIKAVPLPVRDMIVESGSGYVTFGWLQYFNAVQSTIIEANAFIANPFLTALAQLNGVGFMVQTGPSTFTEAILVPSDTILVTGGNGTTGTVSFKLADSGVAAGVYGDPNHTLSITVDEFGRVVSAITSALPPIAPQPISFTGDVTGSGHTGTPVALTVAAIDGVSLPPPSTGVLTFDGTLLSWETPPEGTTTVTLGAAFVTNQPYRVVAGVAQPITSLDASEPWCDGVTLESGSATQTVTASNTQSNLYTTILALPGSDGDILWLGQDGKLTNTVPSVSAGDVWSVPIVRRVSSLSFVFSQPFQVKL